jgi:hypothetical protein
MRVELRSCKDFTNSQNATGYKRQSARALSEFFIYQLMHKRVALKRILKFTLKSSDSQMLLMMGEDIARNM